MSNIYKKSMISPAQGGLMSIWGVYKRKTFLFIPYWSEMSRVLTERKADRLLMNLRLIEKTYMTAYNED